MSIAVFALTLGFVVVTAAAARWRPLVRCRCFGALADSRFGQTSVARSAALALGSGLVVAGASDGRLAAYPMWTTGLLLVLAALFALGCAAAANALDLVQRGASNP